MKKSILVLCGGQSTEHEISLLSARNVASFLNKDNYDVAVAKIHHDGPWFYFKNAAAFLSNAAPDGQITLSPGHAHPFHVNQQALAVDCIFPVLHGTNGEDGTIQGLLELLAVPYVGADCLGSAIGMDKEVMKRLLEAAGLPVVPRCLVRKQERSSIDYASVTKILGSTLFIKPNSLGSAVGINKATDQVSFNDAVENAFQYDEYVLIEKAIVGREIECSVLGNENPKVSLPGEIIKHTDFYSYDAKYVDDAAATVKTPADLSPALIQKFQQLSLEAYKVLRTTGMARVDFFLATDGQIYLNEINTIPGFTNISMYPKNWEAAGLHYPELLDALIVLAFERNAFKKALNRNYVTSSDILP